MATGKHSNIACMASRADIDPLRRERIAAWLDYYIKRRDWTRQRMADELHVSEPTVTNAVNRKRTPGLDLLIKMHDHLKLSTDDLLDTDPPKRSPTAG